jgi:hypothetical protein
MPKSMSPRRRDFLNTDFSQKSVVCLIHKLIESSLCLCVWSNSRFVCLIYIFGVIIELKKLGWIYIEWCVLGLSMWLRWYTTFVKLCFLSHFYSVNSSLRRKKKLAEKRLLLCGFISFIQNSSKYFQLNLVS